ncbi:MAG: hypothetical protein DCC67_00340 [Planctomycetota bacterium]|nr:MAG: hypothetical protein DCC67_00340 [Planctomycetota bacterium]
MDRDFYLQLAAEGHRVPIGTDLILRQRADADAVVLDGQQLGGVIVEAAQRYRTPLAIPLMDLRLEKQALLADFDLPAEAADAFHVADQAALDQLRTAPATPRMDASCAAIGHVAQCAGLVPIGMCIGPFSLMTKMIADPITPVYLAGAGQSSRDAPEIALMEECLAAGVRLIRQYVRRQLDAGAKAIIVCEPAANVAYFSPNQLARSFSVFDRYVMEGLRALQEALKERDADLILHDCGELTDGMVARLASLEPAILSLGSSRRLWEDARLVPRRTVLYGNLPTKRFFSPELPLDEVVRLTGELTARMKTSGHPFILGSECDVLSVPDCEQEIADKVAALLTAAA